MPKWIILLLFFMNSAHANDWKALYKKSLPSIPIVFQAGGVCSGALIEPDLILTAAHCVAYLREISVMFKDKKAEYIPGRVVAIHRENDLALVRIDTKQTDRPLLKLRKKSAELFEGESVATIGHPTSLKMFKNPAIDYDSTYLISTGVVSKVIEKDYIVDLSVSPGNSGGPMFNAKGEIVGVISRKRADRLAGNIGYATNHNKINEFYSKFRKMRLQTVTPLMARTRFGFNLSADVHSLLSDSSYDNDISTSIYTFGVHFTLLSYLHLQYSESFANSDIDYSNYGIGWVFYWPLRNRMVGYVIPAIESYRYTLSRDFSNTPNGVEIDENGYSVKFGFTSLPLSLKYGWFDLNGQSESVLTFQLSF